MSDWTNKKFRIRQINPDEWVVEETWCFGRFWRNSFIGLISQLGMTFSNEESALSAFKELKRYRDHKEVVKDLNE